MLFYAKLNYEITHEPFVLAYQPPIDEYSFLPSHGSLSLSRTATYLLCLLFHVQHTLLLALLLKTNQVHFYYENPLF